MTYERKKKQSAERSRSQSLAGRDIGAIPPVVDSARKAATFHDFRAFCEFYFADRFKLAWSNDHLGVITSIEASVLHGGLYAMAMPRGSGKTTICECAALWAMFTGVHPFVFLIGSCEEHAVSMLGNVKAELANNDTLLADWPEICYPIRALENQSRRCIGQMHYGQPTNIVWRDDRIAMPVIPGSRAAGAIIRVAGLTGNLRGAIYQRADGSRVRPSLVVIDDPQTDQSARSATQCAQREAILSGAVLGLAGPGKKISGIMPCTVIQKGDMADNILDRKLHPDWNGTRTKMVYSFPTNETLWEQYAEIRADGLRAGDGGRSATEFYAEHRDAMDEGSEIAWPARHNADELSAIQHAMNLKFRNEAAFLAEYQNEPLSDDVGATELTQQQIAAKINRVSRAAVPSQASRLTAFIDVHQAVLFYVVAAWEDNFSGYIVDYGTFPDQRRALFTLADARYTLATATKASGIEGAIYAGLEALADSLLGREWKRDDGTPHKIERCLVDANWGDHTELVYQFCRQSAHAAVLMPSHGRYVGAASQPFSDYKRKAGERIGLNWRVPNVTGKRAIRHVTFDTNFWKSFIHARLAVSMGAAGCLSLFGEKPSAHSLFAEHLTAEYRVTTEGRGRTVDEWKQRPERRDNHWLDCAVGAAVAAAMQGVALAGQAGVPTTAPRTRKSFSEMQRNRRQLAA